MKQADTIFLPLGGTGEIGMNCNLYGVAGKDGYEWIMVDLGVTFAKGENALAGIDLIMPDTSFIEKAGGLQALLLTHGHEDHLGAVAHLWRRLQCPIYATPFTAELMRQKLAEQGLEDAPLHIIDINAHLQIGAFTIDYITLTHSIAEPSALAIRATHKNGTTNILHTGDWKIDPDPIIGAPTQEDRLKAFGDEGIDAIICDSTNALVAGRAGSEGMVAKNLRETIARCKNQVVVTAFASNVARLASVTQAASACGRVVCLAGRGMHRIVAAAQKTGYLKDLPPFVEEDNISDIPRGKRLILCTGSQGEERAALARLARGDHRHLSLKKGDHVIFSSRVIPGNE
ncbi:MAG: ribonuclease J, partial [Alphaproteobacteria bacterium]|nr:ribonuclease J [Alphaproteobacteria bacterium]